MHFNFQNNDVSDFTKEYYFSTNVIFGLLDKNSDRFRRLGNHYDTALLVCQFFASIFPSGERFVEWD